MTSGSKFPCNLAVVEGFKLFEVIKRIWKSDVGGCGETELASKTSRAGGGTG